MHDSIFVDDERNRERVLKFIQPFGSSALIDCQKCALFPLNEDELKQVSTLLEGVKWITVTNSDKINTGCWVEIMGFKAFADLLRRLGVHVIILDPPLLMFVLLETLGLPYKLSRTSDGPRRISAPD